MKNQKTQIQINTELILLWTGWGHAELCDFIFTTAYAYMREVLKLDKELVKLFSNDQLFWTWWCDEWNKHDELLINDYVFTNIFEKGQRNDFELLYTLLHTGDHILEIKPPSKLFRHLNKMNSKQHA